jgi:hypothetical protein
LQGQNGIPELSRQAFFEELLSLVYRFIFLATVEDRTDRPRPALDLCARPPEPVRQRILAGYSLTGCAIGRRRSAHDAHHDLWQALSITFERPGRRPTALGLPALGGLFDPDQCRTCWAPRLRTVGCSPRCSNSATSASGPASPASTTATWGPRSWAASTRACWSWCPTRKAWHPPSARLAFVGDDDTTPNKGNTRKLTGSYYTPDSLVQELIKSALEPVIAKR